MYAPSALSARTGATLVLQYPVKTPTKVADRAEKKKSNAQYRLIGACLRPGRKTRPPADMLERGLSLGAAAAASVEVAAAAGIGNTECNPQW